jgi:hypothetical protein
VAAALAWSAGKRGKQKRWWRKRMYLGAGEAEGMGWRRRLLPVGGGGQLRRRRWRGAYPGRDARSMNHGRRRWRHSRGLRGKRSGGGVSVRTWGRAKLEARAGGGGDVGRAGAGSPEHVLQATAAALA